jgi:hypothetical protein
MPRSALRTFTDPDDYASAIRATNAELPKYRYELVVGFARILEETA